MDGGHIFDALDSELYVNTFLRCVGNLFYIIDVSSGKIISSTTNIKLNPIKLKKYNQSYIKKGCS